MRRREFITMLGGAALGWPLRARAQPAIPVVGYLETGSPISQPELAPAFRQGLSEIGFVEGRNVAIDYRFSEGRYDLMPGLASELVRHQVAVIFAGGPPAAQAAKAATGIIPIVFANGADPIQLGLVASFNRPGGNVTGISFIINALGAKQLEIMHDVVPEVGTIDVLVNPNNQNSERQLRDLQAGARTLGLQIQVWNAGTESEIDKAFTTLVQQRAGAIAVTADAFLGSRRNQIVALATRHAIPTISPMRALTMAGALASYGTNIPDAFRQAGIYVGRILKGENPSDLPVIQPTKFEFVINLRTAKAIGLSIPPTLLALADEVIE